MTFNKWLDVFLDEKGIDLSEHIDVKKQDGTIGQMPVSFITEHIKVASPNEKKSIKNTLVMIDFRNASVHDYLAHLGQALWGEYDKYIAVL